MSELLLQDPEIQLQCIDRGKHDFDLINAMRPIDYRPGTTIETVRTGLRIILNQYAINDPIFLEIYNATDKAKLYANNKIAATNPKHITSQESEDKEKLLFRGGLGFYYNNLFYQVSTSGFPPDLDVVVSARQIALLTKRSLENVLKTYHLPNQLPESFSNNSSPIYKILEELKSNDYLASPIRH
jgi:hypothetical protein